MKINRQKLADFTTATREELAKLEERLALSLHIEELVKSRSKETDEDDTDMIEIPENLVLIPTKYSDEAIHKIFEEISEDELFLIVPSSQKQCLFQ